MGGGSKADCKYVFLPPAVDLWDLLAKTKEKNVLMLNQLSCPG